MSRRIEWRSKGEGHSALVTVDGETNLVTYVWPAGTELITNFLNKMDRLTSSDELSVGVHDTDPESFGMLIMARSEDGDVVTVEPQRYWESIGFFFRDHGIDPHPYTRAQ